MNDFVLITWVLFLCTVIYAIPVIGIGIILALIFGI